MSKLSFQIAVADKEAAKKDREVLHLQVMDIAGEDYAVVRPSLGTLMMVMQVVPGLRGLLADPGTRGQGVGVLVSFFEETMRPDDLRAALGESGDYLADDDELSPEGEELVNSYARLIARFIDRNDDLGDETLADVTIGLTEHWAGNPTGSPADSSTGQKHTGGSSTASNSRKAPTSSKSATSRRRAS